MMQICGPEALGLHSCKLRWDQNEDGMLRTFIPAGCGLRSVGPGKPCNRERLSSVFLAHEARYDFEFSLVNASQIDRNAPSALRLAGVLL